MDEKQLVEEILTKRSEVASIEETLKNAKSDLSRAEGRLIQYLQDRDQTRTGSYEGLGSISIRSFNTYKVSEENKDMFFKFLKDNDLGSVVKETIHHKTMDRVINDLITEGKAVPEYVESFNITTVQVNK
jgi:hypothetical protein